ncbi:ABC transporter permease subunit [Solidesulfovibrio sp.]|uniref:ABC transporter permease subunit n=1 Tax=Solidesulfovibrio sp. TaxID=2910990 RepID=UPI00260557DD|nr:ABC transporter permease subunit [Solidesulfovibrio sp.]
MAVPSDTAKGWIWLSLVVLLLFLGVWALFALTSKTFPSPAAVARESWFFLSRPFYDGGPNDKGIAILTAYSLARLCTGFLAGSVVAILLGVILGLNQTLFKALNPYIQMLKAISPIAWMPLLLYSVKDSGWAALLVVFMASLWPTLANTAFGVSNIKADYLNIANILQMKPLTKVCKVILPAAGPTIVAGLKISMGSAWVAIVPAEALLGSLGLGYFVWNEWNNLSLASVIFAILIIGVVGVLIDNLFSRLAGGLAYVD